MGIKEFMVVFMAVFMAFLCLINPLFASTNINDCADLTVAGETYYLTADITNKDIGKCMYVKADDITLDCQGHTIDGIDYSSLYGTTYGIYITNNYDNITIKNCVLSDWYDGLYVLSTYNINILDIESYSSYCSGTSGGYGLYISDTNNVNVTNFNSHDNGKDGIVIYYPTTDNIKLTNIISNNNSGNGIEINYETNNTFLENVTTNYNTRYGIYTLNSPGRINFVDVTASYNGYSGIRYQGSGSSGTTWNMTDIVAYNNTQYGLNLEFIQNFNLTNITAINNSAGVYLGFCKDVSIQDSILKDSFGFDLYTYSRNITECITTKNLTGTDDKPIYYLSGGGNLSNWNNNVTQIILCDGNYTLNNISLSRTDKHNNGIILTGSGTSTISNLTMDNVNSLRIANNEGHTNLYDIYLSNVAIGLYFLASPGSTSGSVSSRNVSIENTTYGMITGSSINISGISMKNGVYGISPGGWYDDSNISDCTIENFTYGIYLTQNKDNSFNNVTIEDCDYGVYLSGTRTYNTVKNSLITNNDYGIYLNDTWGMRYNNFYNNFLNNTVNYYNADSGSSYTAINYLNTTKQVDDRIYSDGNLIGGNYWANLTGSGFSDSCTDSDKDGFCDNYYNFSNGDSIAIDYLPLSNQYTPIFNVTLNLPEDNGASGENKPYFNFTVLGNDFYYDSCELLINDSGYGILTSVPDNISTEIHANTSLSGGVYSWYVNCTVSGVSNHSSSRSLTINETLPAFNEVTFHRTFSKTGGLSYCSRNNVYYSTGSNTINDYIYVKNRTQDHYLIVKHIKNSNTLTAYVNSNNVGVASSVAGSACNGDNWVISIFNVSNIYIINNNSISITPSGTDNNYISYIALVEFYDRSLFGEDWEAVTLLNITSNAGIDVVLRNTTNLENFTNKNDYYIDFWDSGSVTGNINFNYMANNTLSDVEWYNISKEVDATNPIFSSVSGNNTRVIRFNQSSITPSFNITITEPHLQTLLCYFNNSLDTCNSLGTGVYEISPSVSTYGYYYLNFSVNDSIENYNETHSTFQVAEVGFSKVQDIKSSYNLILVPHNSSHTENTLFNFVETFVYNFTVPFYTNFSFFEQFNSFSQVANITNLTVYKVTIINQTINETELSSRLNGTYFYWNDSLNGTNFTLTTSLYKAVINANLTELYWQNDITNTKKRYYRINAINDYNDSLKVKLKLYLQNAYDPANFHSELWECDMPSAASRYSCEGTWYKRETGSGSVVSYLTYDTTLSDKLYYTDVFSGGQTVAETGGGSLPANSGEEIIEEKKELGLPYLNKILLTPVFGITWLNPLSIGVVLSILYLVIRARKKKKLW